MKRMSEKKGVPLGGTDWQRGIKSNLVPSVQAALVAAYEGNGLGSSGRPAKRVGMVHNDRNNIFLHLKPVF